jgi:hypothetical protein
MALFHGGRPHRERPVVVTGTAVLGAPIVEAPSRIRTGQIARGTLLNKDMLRLMFVLEGCRSRPDLEAKMDWGNNGRVLVLEKLAR